MSIRDLIKYSAVPAVIVDKYDLKIIHVNEKAAELTHFSRSGLTGKFLADLLTPLSTEAGDYDRVVLQTKSGTRTLVHVNIQAVLGHNFLLVNFWEIHPGHENHSLEEEVIAWRLAFEEYNAPLTIHSADYELLDANQAACKALGMSKDQLIGKKCYQLFHGKEHPTAGCPLKKLIETGNHVSRVVELESLGEKALVDCSPVFDENGQLLRVVHTALDVGSVVKMDQESTERKILEEGQEQYGVITQSSFDAIITLDQHGKIVGWNPSATRIFGYEQDEILGKMLSQIIPAKYLRRRKINFQSPSSHGRFPVLGKTIELRGLRKNNTEFPAELTLSEWEISSGKFFSVTLRDISARKLHEEALREERNFSEAVLQSLPGIFYMFTYPDLRLTRWNKYHEKLLGFTSRELKDKFITDWFLPESRGRLMDALKEVMEKGFATMDSNLITKDGSIIPCILTGVRIKINNQQFIMGVGTDISQRKKMEEELSKSEAQLRTLLNTLPDLVWLKDEKGVYLACNEAFERYMNRRADEIIGKTDFDLVEPDRAKVFQQQDEEAIRLGRSLASEEWTVLNNNGDRAFVETKKTPMYDNAGKFMGVLGLGHDLTQRKKAEAEVEKANELLLKINAEKDKFFSIIAHDLRNPLTSFLGLTQILDENLSGLSLGQIREMAQVMKKSAGNLFQLLENLLSWANMQQGLISFKPERIALHEQVEEVVEQSVQEMARAKNIQVSYEVSPGIRVFADKNMVQAVIRNLLSNAIKFTPKKGKIILSVNPAKKGFVEVKISDNGMGMSREILDNLFLLNANTSRPGTEGEHSTGLGLLLCKEFITKHGGRIWAESKEGKGSIFHFSLPVKTMPQT